MQPGAGTNLSSSRLTVLLRMKQSLKSQTLRSNTASRRLRSLQLRHDE
jgi:hypothetical protein